MIEPIFDVWCSVVAYKTPAEEIERLIATLACVRARTMLTVIDNSASLPSLSSPTGLSVEVICPGRNLGYGRANNLGIERSRGRCRYHLVINSDVVFEPAVIDRLVDFMDGRPTAGLVMPNVRYPDGSLQHLCRLLPSPAVLIGRRFFGKTAWATRLNANYELRNWSYDRIANLPFLSGCFMFTRREVLDRVGYFDPRYFLYAEDLDLSRRIHCVSETLFYPDVEIVHEYRSLKRRSWRHWMYGMRSLAQYFHKWGWLHDNEREAINRVAIRRLAESPTGLVSEKGAE